MTISCRQEILPLATDAPYSSSAAELWPLPGTWSGSKPLLLQAQLLQWLLCSAWLPIPEYTYAVVSSPDPFVHGRLYLLGASMSHAQDQLLYGSLPCTCCKDVWPFLTFCQGQLTELVTSCQRLAAIVPQGNTSLSAAGTLIFLRDLPQVLQWSWTKFPGDLEECKAESRNCSTNCCVCWLKSPNYLKYRMRIDNGHWDQMWFLEWTAEKCH